MSAIAIIRQLSSISLIMFVSDFEGHSEANQATGPHDTKMCIGRPPLKIWATSLLILLTSTTTLGQAQPTSQPTFHISGKITQSGRAVPGIWVTFEGAIPKSVKGNDSGFYQADLPLGTWRVFASGFNERDRSEFSRPRVFQVNKARKVALDLFVRPAVGCGGVMILTSDGRPPTREQVEQKNEFCAGQEFFPVPSADGVPFEVLIGGLCDPPGVFHGINEPACKNEFATYNLLTMRADSIVYRPTERTLDANGNVVVTDESGETKARSMILYLQDGRAVRMHQDR